MLLEVHCLLDALSVWGGMVGEWMWVGVGVDVGGGGCGGGTYRTWWDVCMIMIMMMVHSTQQRLHYMHNST